MAFSRFAVNSYTSPALSLSAQRVVNARTVKAQPGAKTQTPVFRCPGIAAFQTFPAPIRGANLVGDRLIVVAGTTAYGVSSSGTLTALGSIPGSGKSTTLYAALQGMDAKSRNIVTVEDPVEYDLPGVGQIQVNPKVGMTFAAGPRSPSRATTMSAACPRRWG